MDTNDRTESQSVIEQSGSVKKSRRRYSLSQKREMVEATLDGGQSVSVVARKYDVNANQLFRWRKQYLDGHFDKNGAVKLLPVQVAESAQPMASDFLSDGVIELTLSKRHPIRITGRVCQQSLATILKVLS